MQETLYGSLFFFWGKSSTTAVLFIKYSKKDEKREKVRERKKGEEQNKSN